jgi:hypothetical protein
VLGNSWDVKLRQARPAPGACGSVVEKDTWTHQAFVHSRRRCGKRERTQGMAGEGSRQGGLGNPDACAMQRCLVSVFSTEARPSLFKLTLLFN